MADAALPAHPGRRSPLSHRAPIEGDRGAIRIAERQFLGKFILRVDPGEAADLLLGVVGMSLPTLPLSSATAADMALLWLGPDEWMLVAPPEQADAAFADAEKALGGVHHQLVAVGEYYTLIEVSGPRAREALMKLTTLDLHPRAFKAGMVAGSMFGRTHATLWQVADDAPAYGKEDGPLFRLFVRWSMADYLWCLIADAAREFGTPEALPIGGETLTIA
jgi:heterotetrameric sarcosine oxidase gamma subunit